MRNQKQPTVLKYGGHGVEVALRSMTDPGPDEVFWSQHRNSFVLAADDRGAWLTASGERVALVSVNGIGEVRWTVERSNVHDAQGAIEHFGLVPTQC